MKYLAITDSHIEKLKTLLISQTFAHQHEFFKARHERQRSLLKSRQIGADWYFALEALTDAAANGEDQVFLTAENGWKTPQQYVLAFARFAGIIGSDDEEAESATHFRLSNGAQITFFDETAHFACHSGNVYVSEYAWANKPANMIKIAKGIAAHKRYRLTFYTSASQNKAAFKAYQSLVAHSGWSKTVTAQDAINSGCTLFDNEWLQELKSLHTPEDFKMLYECEWVIDSEAEECEA